MIAVDTFMALNGNGAWWYWKAEDVTHDIDLKIPRSRQDEEVEDE